MSSLVSIYSGVSWNELFANNREIPFHDPALAWVETPPEEFRRFLIGHRPLSFDGVPPDPDTYKRDVTYSVVQMHRLWVTTNTLRPHVPRDGLIVDLGAFPFVLEVLLREYIGFRGRIHATVNLELKPEWLADLAPYSVETAMLDMDPYVVDPSEPRLPQRLGLADSSADLVILAHVIEHLYHPMQLMREVQRVLKPGGKLLLSTDNAMMLSTLLNMCGMNEFVYEPVQQMAPMAFHFWRGHNRFYTAADLSALLAAAGLRTVETRFFEVFYSSFSDEHFHRPAKTIPAWRADILGKLPGYRNEVIVVAEKI
jgi:SAM-dependent methyltransferase